MSDPTKGLIDLDERRPELNFLGEAKRSARLTQKNYQIHSYDGVKAVVDLRYLGQKDLIVVCRFCLGGGGRMNLRLRQIRIH